MSELVQLEDIDSTYEAVLSKQNLVKTAEDSAFYNFSQGMYWMRKSDFATAQKLFNKSGIILERLKREAPLHM